jgi:DNA polymerase-3 subunit delta
MVSLSRDTLHAKEAGPEAIVSAALTLPFLSARRLVVLRGAEALGPKASEPLVGYLRAPNPSSVLLLVADQALDPSHWLVQVIGPSGVVMVGTPSGRALHGWLGAWAVAEGIEMTSEAADLLVELVGDDLAALAGEARKAALAGDPPGRVTVEEIRAVVGERRLRHVFDLSRALEARDAAGALAVLQALLASGEEPIGLVALMARDARAAWQVAQWQRSGRAPEEIARRLRRPAAASASIQALAASLTPASAAERMERCFQVERRLKLGSPPRPELAQLVMALCSG